MNYAIDVVIDPTQSKTGAAAVEKQLQGIEQEAIDLRRAMADAITLDPSRSSAGAAAVEKQLQGIEGEAFDLHKALAESVTIDPKQAAAGAAAVEKQLAQMEQDAFELRKALIEAVSVKDSGTGATLSRIEQILARTEEQALITSAKIGQLGRGNVSPIGIQKVNKELDVTKEKADSVGKTIKQAFAFIGVSLLAKEFVDLSDQITNVQNKLRLVTGSIQELTDTQKRLFDVSNATRSSFEGTATIFNRLAISAKELGVNNEQLLQFTESLNQAIILSGASAQEASAGLLQLSQGLASGSLRGDELRSVLEQLPAVADVIAKGLKVTRGELRTLGEQGKISATAVLEAFAAARDELAGRFATTVPTIGQAFTVLQNKVGELVGSFNTASGVGGLFAKALIEIANNLEPIIRGVETLALTIGTGLALNAIPKAIEALKTLEIAAKLSTAAAFAAVTFSVYAFNKALQDNIDDQKAIGQAALDSVERLTKQKTAADLLTAAQRELNEAIRNFAPDDPQIASAAAQVQKYKEQLDKAVKSQQAVNLEASKTAAAQKEQAEAVKRQSVLLEKIQKPLTDYKNLQVDLNTLLAAGTINQKQFNEELAAGTPKTELSPALVRQAEILDKIKKPLEDYKKLQSDLVVLFEKGTIAQEDFNRLLAEGQAALDKSTATPFEAELQALKDQNEELKIRKESFGAQREAALLELDLQKQFITLNEDEKKSLLEQLTIKQQLTEAAQKRAKKEQELVAIWDQRIARLDALRGEIDVNVQIKKDLEDLIDLRGQEGVSIALVDAALVNLRIRQLEASNELADGFERAFLKIKKQAEDLASVGEEITNVFVNDASNAIAEFARTGQLDFKEFANSLLADITKIIARLLVVQALNAVIGAVGGGSGEGAALSAAIGAGTQHRAAGGTVNPGQRFTVGEHGPEQFVPNRTGTIVPNAASIQQEPPQVNLTVVNVEDARKVPQAINDGLADEAIVNVLSRKRDVIRQLQN